MFAIELGAPFLIFAPRRMRFFGGAAIAFLQILILLTGNYTFFNFLTLALCLLLLDDFALTKLMPARFRPVCACQRVTCHCHSLALARAVTIPLAAVVILAISLFQVVVMFGVPTLVCSRRCGWSRTGSRRSAR